MEVDWASLEVSVLAYRRLPVEYPPPWQCSSTYFFNYEVNVADINCRKENLTIIKYINEKFVKENKNLVFIFDNGKVLANYYQNHNLITKEYAYVHLQKRQMINNISNSSKFIITYNSFNNYFELDEKAYRKNIYKGLDFKWIKFKFRAIKNRTKRFFSINKIIKGRS